MSEETDRIESDINESRHRLNDTLSQLGSKLSPGQMLDEALGLAQGQAGQFTANLGRQVRDNPLPAVLIAAGIGLYLMNRGQQQQHHTNNAWSADDWHADSQYRSLQDARWRIQRDASETEDAYQHRLHEAHAQALNLRQNAGEAIDAFKQRVADTAHGIETKAGAARERMSQVASNAAHAVSAGVHQLGAKAGEAKHNVQNLYDDSPLVGGAIALALGAILGSAAPLTSTERRTLSDVAQNAADAGAQIAEKGARALEQAPEAIH